MKVEYIFKKIDPALEKEKTLSILRIFKSALERKARESSIQKDDDQRTKS